MEQEFWEQRYSQADQVWSGKVNPWLRTFAPDLAPGTALDLACGEGGDALWLAEQGWAVTAVDFAASGLRRGAEAAQAAGLADRIRWVQADLGSDWRPDGTYDLVAMHYFHTPEPKVRETALRTAWAATAGTLLIVSHDPAHAHEGGAGPPESVLYGPEVVLDALGLDLEDPVVLVAETRRRESDAGTKVDAVVVARRSGMGA